MADRCKKAAGAKLVLCDAAQHAVSSGFLRQQSLRNFETKKSREQLAIVKGREYAPLRLCPWCGRSIDTRPIERTIPGDAA